MADTLAVYKSPLTQYLEVVTGYLVGLCLALAARVLGLAEVAAVLALAAGMTGVLLLNTWRLRQAGALRPLEAITLQRAHDLLRQPIGISAGFSGLGVLVFVTTFSLLMDEMPLHEAIADRLSHPWYLVMLASIAVILALTMDNRARSRAKAVLAGTTQDKAQKRETVVFFFRLVAGFTVILGLTGSAYLYAAPQSVLEVPALPPAAAALLPLVCSGFAAAIILIAGRQFARQPKIVARAPFLQTTAITGALGVLFWGVPMALLGLLAESFSFGVSGCLTFLESCNGHSDVLALLGQILPATIALSVLSGLGCGLFLGAVLWVAGRTAVKPAGR